MAEDSESAISKFMSNLDTVQGGYARGVLGLALSGAKDNPFFALTPLGGMADLVRMPDDTAQRVRAGMQQDGIRGALAAADQAYHEADESVPGVKFAMETPFDPTSYMGVGLGAKAVKAGSRIAAQPGRNQQSSGHRDSKARAPQTYATRKDSTKPSGSSKRSCRRSPLSTYLDSDGLRARRRLTLLTV